MTVLMTLALAQEAPLDDTESLELLTEENTRLNEDLRRLEQELAEQEESLGRGGAVEALLADVALTQDLRVGPEERLAAMSRMVDRAIALEEQPLARQLLLASAQDRDTAVREGALGLLADLDGAEELDWLARHAKPSGVRMAAIDELEGLGTSLAGELLFAQANDEELARDYRAAATEALERSYPALLDQKGAPQAGSSGGGLAGAAIGNALLGGTVLSTVGVLGQNDAAVGIGVYGGGGIGAASGVLYGMNNPVTTADGSRYASSVSWGLANGVVLGEAAFYRARGNGYDNGTAMLRTAGVVAGAGQGWWAYKNDKTDLHDVWESNGAGWLGAGTALGLTLMATDSWNQDNSQQLLVAASLGSMTGLATQAALRDRWQPDSPDVGFAGLVAGNAAWTATWMPVALDRYGVDGRGLLASHAGASLALVAAHKLEPSWTHNGMMAWGTVLGNSLGAGLPLLADAKDETTVAVMLPMGLAGAGLGYVAGGRVEFHGGDRAMLGVGVPLVTLQSLGYGGVLAMRQNSFEESQMAGLMLTGEALGGIGLTAVSQRWDPNAGQMLLLGSGALWGAWYGVLTPIALDLDGEPEDLLLSTLVASDLGLVAAGVATYGLDVHPRSTLSPQLGGVAGATFGSLAVSLVSPEPRAASAGALLGSVAGFAGGTLFEMRVAGPKRAERQALGLKPRSLDLPGTWSASAAPWAAPESGDLGVYGQVSWREGG